MNFPTLDLCFRVASCHVKSSVVTRMLRFYLELQQTLNNSFEYGNTDCPNYSVHGLDRSLR